MVTNPSKRRLNISGVPGPGQRVGEKVSMLCYLSRSYREASNLSIRFSADGHVYITTCDQNI